MNFLKKSSILFLICEKLKEIAKSFNSGSLGDFSVGNKQSPLVSALGTAGNGRKVVMMKCRY